MAIQRLYTRTGDDGYTYCVLNKQRVSKAHPCIELMGALDEAEAWLGYASSLLPPVLTELSRDLEWLQELLFRIGFTLAGNNCIDEEDVEKLEKISDKYMEGIELKGFVLSGGHPAAAAISITRTVVRKLERRLVACMEEGIVGKENNWLQAVVNRLSDALFAISLWVNKRLGYEPHYVPPCRPRSS